MQNKAMLLGKVYSINKEPTKNGKQMCRFNLLTFSYQGEGKEDKAQFHRIVAYGSKAEVLNKYCDDKRDLLIFGEIDYYKDKDGHTNTQIIVDEFEFADGKKPEAVA